MNQIKILYFYNGVFDGGGIQSVIFNYFEKLNKKKYHVDFVLHGKRPKKEVNKNHIFLLKSGSKLFYVTKRSTNFRENEKQIKQIFSENHYDIVHTHMDASGYYPLKIAKKCGVKCLIAHSHNTNFIFSDQSKLKRFVHFLVSQYCRFRIRKIANVRIAVSEQAGKWLFGNHSFIVLPNAIDEDKFLFNNKTRSKIREQLGLIDSDVGLVNVGRLGYPKNQELLVKVMRQLDDKYRLFLVGSGKDFKKLKILVTEFNLESRVIFLGQRNDVSILLQGMDIFLLPSFFEGLPVSLIEAQAAGLPCIASDNVPKESAIIKNSVEFLPLDVGSWLERISSFKKNSCLKRLKVSESFAISPFSIRSQIYKLEKIYDEGEKFDS